MRKERDMTKTFKIGEYCVGVIVKASTQEGMHYVEVLNWETKNVMMAKRCRDINAMRDFLEGITTYYYAEKITNFLNGKR